MSRGHPKPDTTPESDGGLSLCCCLVPYKRGSVSRVIVVADGFVQEGMIFRITSGSNLLQVQLGRPHPCILWLQPRPLWPPDVSSSLTPATHHPNQWLSWSSHLPYPGPVPLPDAPFPVHIFASSTPFTLSLAIQPTTSCVYMCPGCARPTADLLERIEGYRNLSYLMRLRGFGQRSPVGRRARDKSL